MTNTASSLQRMESVRLLVLGGIGAGKSSLVEATMARLSLSGKVGMVTKKDVTSGLGAHCHALVVEYGGGGGGTETHGGYGEDAVLEEGGEAYVVELVEVGANERFARLRPLFYQGVDGVLIVFDLTAGCDADFWIAELRENGLGVDGNGGSEGFVPPLMVIGNKEDLAMTDVKRRALMATGGDSVLDIWMRKLWLSVKGTIYRIAPWVERRVKSMKGGRMRGMELLPDCIEDGYRGPIVRMCATSSTVDIHEIEAFIYRCIENKRL